MGRTKRFRSVINFCLSVIREKERITISELYELVKKEFPQYSFTRQWLSWHLGRFVKKGVIYRMKVNKQAVYSTKPVKIERKDVKRCIVCGTEIPKFHPPWCSIKCAEELEKLVNAYIPVPEIVRYSLAEIKEKVWVQGDESCQSTSKS
ncbi:hypothetical protein DRP04_05565 [Archaeoglobales archaeon]|nr:MAG: hypothetical protein DRP04_05565 [Archaeoglobales archaeon]